MATVGRWLMGDGYQEGSNGCVRVTGDDSWFNGFVDGALGVLDMVEAFNEGDEASERLDPQSG